MSDLTETKAAESLLFGHYLRTDARLAGEAALAFLETKARDQIRAEEQKSAEALLLGHYLRTGERLQGKAAARFLEVKFNQRHYPENGQFARAGEGMLYGSGANGAVQSGRFSRANAVAANTRNTRLLHVSSNTAQHSHDILVIGDKDQQLRDDFDATFATGLKPDPINADRVRAIMPSAGKHADIYTQPLRRAMSAHGIRTPEQQAAFLAQVSVESGNLRHTVENLNYSAERIAQVWPSRFPTVDSAKPYANNPTALANRVYGDRMGNNGIEGAGYRYRGRGLIQVTGRAGYQAIGYVNNPEALEIPEIAAESAARYWRTNSLHLRSRRELSRREFDAISRFVNGGNHGINDRWEAYQRALVALRARRRGD